MLVTISDLDMTRSQARRNSKRSESSTRVEQAGVSEVDASCGTCSREVVSPDGIGCDKCETWVHNTIMCCGLPQNVIDVIMEHSGEGVQYVCMKCRVVRVSNPKVSPSKHAEKFMSETINQLSKQIQGMCALLTDLRAEVNSLKTSSQTATALHTETPNVDTPDTQTNHPDNHRHSGENPATHHDRNTNASTPAYTPDSNRSELRRELRELLERDKRRDSVVIRGLSVTSPGALVAKFGDMTQKVLGVRVVLTDVVRIPNYPDLWRAKIKCDDDRKCVLDGAKNLRDTEYKDVYIRRDLTYAQRGELRQRRMEREAAATADRPSGSAPSQGVNRARNAHVCTPSTEVMTDTSTEVMAETVPKCFDPTGNTNVETAPKYVVPPGPEPSYDSGSAAAPTPAAAQSRQSN